ncbi:MAG: hypothetical protein AB7N76_11735 [Planctomycetota bacterium]
MRTESLLLTVGGAVLGWGLGRVYFALLALQVAASLEEWGRAARLARAPQRRLAGEGERLLGGGGRAGEGAAETWSSIDGHGHGHGPGHEVPSSSGSCANSRSREALRGRGGPVRVPLAVLGLWLCAQGGAPALLGALAGFLAARAGAVRRAREEGA